MGFRFCLLVLIAIAALLRFCFLDGKLLWFDEVYTALRLSGFDDAQVMRAVYTGQSVSVQQLAQFQSLNPQHGLGDTVRSLAVSDAQHPPLYFALLYLWAQVFGTSTTALRSLSAVFGVACLPAAYGLGRECFRSRLRRPGTAGWLLAALVAASPVQGIYSQTARQTSLWVLLLLLGTWALLRALRLGQARDWWGFGLATALALYTTPLTLWALVGQAVFVALDLRVWQRGAWQKHRRTILAFAGASALALLSFVPWGLVMVDRWWLIQRTTDWMKQTPIGGSVLWFWLSNLQRLWWDVYPLLEPLRGLGLLGKVTLLGMAGLIAVGIGAAGWTLWQAGHRRVLALVACLGILPFAVAALPDLISGGQRSAQVRYLMPGAIALDLLLAGGLAVAIEQAERCRRGVQAGAIALVLVGVLSFGRGLHQPTWWNQVTFTDGLQASAAILNQRCCSPKAAAPVVISQDYLGWPFSLVRHLKPQIQIRLLNPGDHATITSTWLKGLPKETYVYRPSPKLHQQIQSLGWQLVPPPGWREPFIALWELRYRSARLAPTPE